MKQREEKLGWSEIKEVKAKSVRWNPYNQIVLFSNLFL